MAYVNVKDWSVEQVTDWLKGLDNVILPYIKSFLNNGVNGHQLLHLRVDDLEHLGVYTLGHQELILESVEHIRNFHYELDKENLQVLALRLSCAANSVNRELQCMNENEEEIQTQTLSDVHNVISALKPLVCWLSRSPFADDKAYNCLKDEFLQQAFKMATFAHRGSFSEKPIQSIRDISEKLTKMADKIIQEMSDPLILQPASLDLTTIKKKEQDLGFNILAGNNGVTQICSITRSPTHLGTKIEEEDEIVQVNYQTVVGWQEKKVVLLMEESPPEIVLTLKKRPRHMKFYGQIYVKPYRLPSKKRAAQCIRWMENLPSPHMLTIQGLPNITMKPVAATETVELETDSSSGSDTEPPDNPLVNCGRLYPLKPRSVLQRRNTITGATPTNARHSGSIEQYLKILKHRAATTHSSSYNLPTEKFEDDSMFTRDKSASCSHGLELTQRPTTVIGLAYNRNNSFKSDTNEKVKKVYFNDTNIVIADNGPVDAHFLEEKKSISTNSLSSLKDEVIEFIDEAEDLQDRSKMNLVVEQVEKKVEPPSVKSLKEYIEENSKIKVNKSSVKDTVLEDVHINNIIKKFDMKVPEKPKVLPRTVNKVPVVPQKPPVLPRTLVGKNRGKLDKSHSTPAYDLTAEDGEFPKDPFSEHSSEESSNTTNENNVSIKYELGIPIVHDVSYSPPIIEARKSKLEVPPKPPPRTNIPDQYKRKLSDIPSSPPPDLIAKPLQNMEKKTEFDFEASINTESLPVFEPPTVSTPVSKNFREDILKVDTHSRSVDRTHKTSPTNIVVRAIYSSKNKCVKKKNTLLAKRRKVSVNDVSPGEFSGYLHQRFRNQHWENRWFVLNQHCLYGFKGKDSTKAECYIYLAGFTVTVANEVKSRSNAFKVYHTGTVFYFSAESEELLSSWLELIAAATCNSDPTSSPDQILYSETDNDNDSDTDSVSKSSTLQKPSDGIRKFNSLKKFTSKKRTDSSVSGSTSLDRKWFFNKSHTHKNALPVPTAQFRSYRKIQTSTTTGNFTSHIPNFASKQELPTVNSSSISNLSVDSIPSLHDSHGYQRTKLLNQMHASNPSLCNKENYTFHPPTKSKCSDNVPGSVTLQELMDRETDDSKYDYNDDLPPINPSLIRPDVVYGEIPIRPIREVVIESRASKKSHSRASSDSTETKKESSCFGKRSSSIKSGNHSFSSSSSKSKDMKTNNSLPRTPKIDNHFVSVKQKSNSSKSLVTKDQSYEMIFCPQTTTDVQFAQNRTLDRKMYQDTPKKSLKSAMQYTPMVLPSSEEKRLNSKIGFELNLDEKSHKSGKLKHFFMKQDSKKEKKSSPHMTKAKMMISNESEISWPTLQRVDMYSVNAFSTSLSDITDNPMQNSPPTADYPGLEYPPVFEPETYSLANPQGTFFKMQQSKKN